MLKKRNLSLRKRGYKKKKNPKSRLEKALRKIEFENEEDKEPILKRGDSERALISAWHDSLKRDKNKGVRPRLSSRFTIFFKGLKLLICNLARKVGFFINLFIKKAKKDTEPKAKFELALQPWEARLLTALFIALLISISIVSLSPQAADRLTDRMDKTFQISAVTISQFSENSYFKSFKNEIAKRNQILSRRLKRVKRESIFIAGFWQNAYQARIKPKIEASIDLTSSQFTNLKNFTKFELNNLYNFRDIFYALDQPFNFSKDSVKLSQARNGKVAGAESALAEVAIEQREVTEKLGIDFKEALLISADKIKEIIKKVKQ